MKAKRIPALTWLQFLSCLLVIFGHSFPFVTPYPKALELSKLFVYSFHMPVFVFCSGVLLVLSDAERKYSFFAYIKRRALRLLLPYAAFSLIGIVPKILLSPVLNDSLSFNFLQILRAFFVPRLNIWGHFWFLPMIFICGIIGYWIQKGIRRFPWMKVTLIAICAIGLFVPKLTDWFAISDIVHQMFYFVLGMYTATLFCNAETVSFPIAYSIGGLAALFGGALFLLLYRCHAPAVLRELVVTVLMLTGMFFLVLPISLKYPLKQNSIVSRSYSVFILSWPCQLAIEIALERILHLPYWCIMPPVFIVGVIAPCLIIRLIDRIERNWRHKPLTRLIGG